MNNNVENNDNNNLNIDTVISSIKIKKELEGENNSRNPGKSRALSRWMDSNSHFNPTPTGSSSSSTPCKSSSRATLPALLTDFETSEYDSFRSPSDYGNRSPMSPIILVNSLYSTSVIRHTLKSKSRSDTVLSPSSISVNSSISTATFSSFSDKNKPNLKIFKSPLNRQLSPNYNFYDPTNSAWVPTQYTNKYNHRFQYPADLIRGDKLNHMLQTDSKP